MSSFSTLPVRIQNIIKRTVQIEGGFVDNPKDPGGATKYGVTEKVAREFGYTGDMRDLPIEIACELYAQKYFFKPKIEKVLLISEALATEIFDTGVNLGVSGVWKLVQKAINVSHVYGDGPSIYPTVEAALEGTLSASDVKVLQRALNLCNRNGRDWSELIVDGGCGDKTVKAVKASVAKRTENVMDQIFKKVAVAQFIERLQIPTMTPVNGVADDRTFTDLKSSILDIGEEKFLDVVNGEQALFYINLTEKKSSNEEFIFGWLNNRVEI